MKYIKFLKGEKCPYCTGKSKTDEQYRELLSKLHPELDFSLTKVSECDKDYNITVICPKHGIKHPRLYRLLNGVGGCDECRYDKIRDKCITTIEGFEEKVRRVHGDRYDLSKVVYINARKKVEIICPKRGSFWVTPVNFISRKSGCPICNNSHLEDELSRFFKDNNIKIIHQKHFKWLGLQKLDFYLPDYNIGIECQGIQHFKPTNYPNSETPEEGFERNVTYDIKKYERCKENNLPLYYFTYDIHFNDDYYSNENFGFIYNTDNVFFDKEKLIEKIRGSI